jgi:hypothetical protein
MRKAFGIVIGCTLLCGLVMAAMLAVPPPTNTEIKINLNPLTDGVDIPYFELSKKARDTVSWKNEIPGQSDCTVTFGLQSPFEEEPIVIPKGEVRGPYEPTKAPAPKKDAPEGKVYKYYKYTVTCGGVTFDPGGGMKP